MKHITVLSIIVLSVLSLTACNPLKGYGQEAGANGRPKFFKNARGENVWTCKDNPIYAHEGSSYLKNYGLPLEIGGNFICENGKPALPKDCQGREIRSEAELNAFTTKHQLPLALNDFVCKNGVPTIPTQDLEYWKRTESVKPTCKDARGRKRPCV